ncbi:MAG: VTC domain-containing protein, partial [Phycisphaerae bacterium]|nr:VTC domain-containing protein [Phycisphaerae bacterium]
DLALCRATMAGEKNRFKLRVRFYADDLKSHAFFEIKRRLNDVILKQRVQVRRSSVERLLAGHWPRRSDLVNPARGNFGALQRFCELRDRIRAKGWAFVCYAREAYVPPDNNTVRVTFDRNLMSWRYREDFGLKRSSSVVRPRVGGVILEVKFTDRFPRWIRQMVRIFGLERTSMPKYVMCTKELLKSGSPVLAEYLGSAR